MAAPTITPQGYATWVRWHLLALQANDYALGWVALDIEGRHVLGHTGQVGGFNSEVLIDTAGRSAGFVLTNTTSEGDPSTSWVLQLIGKAPLEIERKLPRAP